MKPIIQSLTSWVASANQENTDFPIQNLPFAIFRRAGSKEDFRGGVAIGNEVLDLAAVKNSGVLSGLAQAAAAVCDNTELNGFMAMGKSGLECAPFSIVTSLINRLRSTR